MELILECNDSVIAHFAFEGCFQLVGAYAIHPYSRERVSLHNKCGFTVYCEDEKFTVEPRRRGEAKNRSCCTPKI